MIPREHAHLFVAAASHAGMSGKNNEDCYTVIAHQVSDSDPTPSIFAIVADGVGGHRAGEVAAEIAVDVISHAVAESDASDPPQILENAIIQASQAIHEQSRSDDAQDGMGSTVACAWILGQRLYTASVGDSRIYLIRDGKIRQLSTDHTWVQEAIEHGIITPDQARGHPRAHVIRRYLGAKNAPEVDLRLRWSDEENTDQERSNQGASLLPDDLLVLCSDGLTDLVDDQEIATLLLSKELEAALAELIALANERGGHDNITVVILKVPPAGKFPRGFRQSKRKTVTSRRRKPWLTCFGIWLVVAIVLAVIATIAWQNTRLQPNNTPLPTTAPAIRETIVPAATPLPSLTATVESLPGVPLQSLTPSYTAWPANTVTPNP